MERYTEEARSLAMSLLALKRHLPERFKNYVALVLTPRVVERERQRAEDVEAAIGIFVAAIEREVRAADARFAALDSEDVRSALSDLRTRADWLATELIHEALGADALLAFIDSVVALGAGGVKSARTTDEVADATSRAIDHLEGYMVSHGHVTEHAAEGRPQPAAVRKLRPPVAVRDVAAWGSAQGVPLASIAGSGARPARMA